MMLSIVRQGTFNVQQLMAELNAQVLGFYRVTGNEADLDCGRIHARPGEVTVVFADDIDPGLINAVLDAHVPRAPAPPRDFKAELRAIPGIPAELKAWLEAVLRL